MNQHACDAAEAGQILKQMVSEGRATWAECTAEGEEVITSPAIRYHGAKFRLAPWFLAMFPPHRCYVEPFGGAAGVLLQKTRAYAEVYGDLDDEMTNFFTVCRDPETRAQLIQSCALTPYARAEFNLSCQNEKNLDPVENARRLCIRAQMSFGSGGATRARTGFRIDTEREYATSMHLWARFPESLARVGERMTGVLIENRDAVRVMQDHDAADTLHFVDPPYLPSTRVSGRQYAHEMTVTQHETMLEAIKALKGMVIVCGYDSELYRDALAGWQLRTKSARSSTNRGTKLALEHAWLNPACVDAQSHGDLFWNER